MNKDQECSRQAIGIYILSYALVCTKLLPSSMYVYLGKLKKGGIGQPNVIIDYRNMCDKRGKKCNTILKTNWERQTECVPFSLT